MKYRIRLSKVGDGRCAGGWGYRRKGPKGADGRNGMVVVVVEEEEEKEEKKKEEEEEENSEL